MTRFYLLLRLIRDAFTDYYQYFVAPFTRFRKLISKSSAAIKTFRNPLGSDLKQFSIELEQWHRPGEERCWADPRTCKWTEIVLTELNFRSVSPAALSGTGSPGSVGTARAMCKIWTEFHWPGTWSIASLRPSVGGRLGRHPRRFITDGAPQNGQTPEQLAYKVRLQ